MLRGNFNNAGGQQVNWDDFYHLQDQVFKSIELQYAGSGAFILQGCQVTGAPGNYTIANGLVFIDGKVLQFSTVTGIAAFPRYIKQATPVPQDSFALEQGGVAYKRVLYKAELVSSAPGSGEYIIITSSGGRTYNDVLSNQFVRLSGNQSINGTKTFTSTISGSINGNAATASNSSAVTNGVYTVGDQTIAGTKTFSSTISGNLSGNVTGNLTGNVTGNISGNASTSTNASFATNAGNATTVTDGVYVSTTQTITGSKTFSQPIVSAGINTDNAIIKKKVLNIGAWNMDSNQISSSISHGIADFTKIRDISAMIISDNGVVLSKLGTISTAGDFSGGAQIVSSTVNLRIYAGNSYDNSAYTNTGINRGWITIEYEA